MKLNQNTTEKLAIAIRLSFPVISISTFETARAAQVVKAVADSIVSSSGASKGNASKSKPFIEAPFKFLPNIDGINRLLEEAAKKNPVDNGLVVFDAYYFDRAKSNPEALPALKSAVTHMEQKGVNYVICGKDTLNDEFVYHVQLPPMSNDEIVQLIETCEGYVAPPKSIFSDAERAVLANHARGLSHTQMKNVFTYCAYLKFKDKPYLAEIRGEKADMLRDVGLDVLEPLSLDAVGGLEHLKDFLRTRQAGWDRDLPVKGILLAGVPGGGKTLTAKAVAGVLGTSLLRLDMGRFYSKYLGETEKLFSRALQTVDEISPVVLLIDEIEKFFGQAEGEHEVSRRLLGTFLYWLQERRGKIFVVATANQIHKLPPELMRAGRWDRCFFVDLPNRAERRKIFEIHLTQVTGSVSPFDLDELVAKSEGYTGAEIEQAVVDARYLANAEDTAVAQAHLTRMLSEISPTSATRRDDIARIRALKDQGFYLANAADADSQSDATSGRRINA